MSSSQPLPGVISLVLTKGDGRFYMLGFVIESIDPLRNVFALPPLPPPPPKTLESQPSGTEKI